MHIPEFRDETSGLLALIIVLALVYLNWRRSDRKAAQIRNRNYKGGAL